MGVGKGLGQRGGLRRGAQLGGGETGTSPAWGWAVLAPPSVDGLFCLACPRGCTPFFFRVVGGWVCPGAPSPRPLSRPLAGIPTAPSLCSLPIRPALATFQVFVFPETRMDTIYAEAF